MSLINVQSLGSKNSIDRRPYTLPEIQFLIENLSSTNTAEELAIQMEEATSVPRHPKLSVSYKLRSIKNWVKEAQNTPEFVEANETGDAKALTKLYFAVHHRRGSK